MNLNPQSKEDEYAELMRQREVANQLRMEPKQQPQQGEQGVNPMQAYNMYQQFSGAGSVGGGGTAGGSAGSGMSGMATAAAPWAALAAGIYLNESNARDKGFRAEDKGQYAKDLVSGKVLSQDLEQRINPKVFGKDDKTGMGADTKAGVDLANLRFRDAWKGFKQGSLAKSLRKIF